MGSVKVSKEVYDALNDYLINYNKELLISDHCNVHIKWEKEKYKCLNEISILKMMEILINGYEFEKTPENELLQYYEEWKVIRKSAIKCSYDDGYIKGVLRSIESTLNILNIKIKGIND